MIQTSTRGPATLAAAVIVALLAGCSSFNRTSHQLVDAITPYQVEVVQGNFVSREQVEALHPGMSREQVRDILGTPLVTSLFHADRWDYVFSMRRKGRDIETKRLTVYFSGFVLECVEGDEMPAETEFVAQLGSRNAKPRVPKLEASPEQLERYAPKPDEGGATAAAAAEPAPRPAGSYPPLER
ncbi:outer membrane protein assembly factor BamE [Corticibacter populi]|uniref:Outer membrane protein assembly factor BamE n=1 Tax=Corticibacter populi TaxID=1550736 RepID=A0A3M6QPR7_9BURK|nr:outer membrane protein assembly factor BamE [Corticibacter populi]RMX05050.1 outer membrane protein assembly factor BamE [Corticibacter populi]RZS33511.1 Beta-barrel assembly machine subunit BamE [Corticibacter populi]